MPRRRRRRWPLAALLWLGSVLLPSRTLTAAPAGELPVALDVEPCVAVAPDRLRALLVLELRVLAESGGPSPPGLTRAHVGCAGPSITLGVSVDGFAPFSQRQLDWTGYPAQGRPRLLALALSEMIVRAWAREAAAAIGGPAPSRPAATPAPAPAPTPAPDAQRAEHRGLHLAVLANLERIGRPQATGVGGDVVLGWRARPWLIAEVGARAGATSLDATPGPVSLRALSLSVSGLAGSWLGHVWLGAGPGIRGGVASLRGATGAADPAGQSTVVPHTLAAFWWGPLARGLLVIPLGRHVAVLTTIEGGYVVRPVVGELGPSATSGNVALDRAWVTAACGVAWMF